MVACVEALCQNAAVAGAQPPARRVSVKVHAVLTELATGQDVHLEPGHVEHILNAEGCIWMHGAAEGDGALTHSTGDTAVSTANG